MEHELRKVGTSLPLPSEHACLGPRRFPIEIFVSAGPAMHLGLADAAIVAAGALVAVLLARRGVVDPAARAGELFNRPYALGHAAAFSFGIGFGRSNARNPSKQVCLRWFVLIRAESVPRAN